MASLSPVIYVPLDSSLLGRVYDMYALTEKGKQQGIKLTMDKDRGLIIMEATSQSAVPLLQRYKDAITLLSFGAPFQAAEKVIGDESVVLQIDLEDPILPSGDIKRILSRLIGKKGSVKQRIEASTNTSIFIKEAKVVIVGSFEAVEKAREAIRRIASGQPIPAVYKYLANLK